VSKATSSNPKTLGLPQAQLKGQQLKKTCYRNIRKGMPDINDAGMRLQVLPVEQKIGALQAV
jgi:hypothetical protein